MYIFKTKDKELADVFFSIVNFLASRVENLDIEVTTKNECECSATKENKIVKSGKRYYPHTTDNGANREYAVEELKNGRSCKVIAGNLGISEHIVRGYKAHMTMGTY